MNLQIGDKAISIKIYHTNLVKQFAEISDDINPIHLDEEFAANSFFKKPIVHGILVSGQISAILANQLPGPGTIYLSQDLKFIAPVFHNDEITCIVEVIEIDKIRNRILLSTKCFNQNNLIVIDGIAKVKI